MARSRPKSGFSARSRSSTLEFVDSAAEVGRVVTGFAKHRRRRPGLELLTLAQATACFGFGLLVGGATLLGLLLSCLEFGEAFG